MQFYKISVRIRLSFCLSIHCNSPAFTTTVFPNWLCWLLICLFTRTVMSILHNTIVYGDIKIYHSNIKRLSVLKQLCSAFENQAANHFHFFYCRTFIKCRMCWVFAQQVTLTHSHTFTCTHAHIPNHPQPPYYCVLEHYPRKPVYANNWEPHGTLLSESF